VGSTAGKLIVITSGETLAVPVPDVNTAGMVIVITSGETDAVAGDCPRKY